MIRSEIECTEAQSFTDVKNAGSCEGKDESHTDNTGPTANTSCSALRNLEEDENFLSNSHIFIRQDKMEKEIVWLFEDIF